MAILPAWLEVCCTLACTSEAGATGASSGLARIVAVSPLADCCPPAVLAWLAVRCSLLGTSGVGIGVFATVEADAVSVFVSSVAVHPLADTCARATACPVCCGACCRGMAPPTPQACSSCAGCCNETALPVLSCTSCAGLCIETTFLEQDCSSSDAVCTATSCSTTACSSCAACCIETTLSGPACPSRAARGCSLPGHRLAICVCDASVGDVPACCACSGRNAVCEEPPPCLWPMCCRVVCITVCGCCFVGCDEGLCACRVPASPSCGTFLS